MQTNTRKYNKVKIVWEINKYNMPHVRVDSFTEPEDRAKSILRAAFKQVLAMTDKKYEEIAVICIGTDSSTGDCFGPLIGTDLMKIKNQKVHIYGSIDNPIYGDGIEKIITSIDTEKTLIIAIDACLGKETNVGKISVGLGGIKPGSALNKKFPFVGDIHIIGVVNVEGVFNALTLQCTRLSNVMRMTNIISSSIKKVLQNYN